VIPAHVIERARGADIMRVLERLGLNYKKVATHELAGPCPACGGNDRFRINPSKGTFFCRQCDAKGGGAIDLMRLARSCDFRGAVGELTGESGPALLRPQAKPKPDLASRQAFVRRTAENIIGELVPLAGTPGEAYLCDARCIDTGALSDVLSTTDAIGWHPECLFRGEGHRLDGRRLGCVVGIMTDPVTAERTGGISRTYVHEGRKVAKAKSLGPAGVVRLTPDADTLCGLHLAEGLETSLSRMACGYRPMWSTGSTSIMSTFPLLSGITSLTIFADNDENGAGEQAALTVGRRWLNAGREVRVRKPRAIGDFNDLDLRASA